MTHTNIYRLLLDCHITQYLNTYKKILLIIKNTKIITNDIV